jgi:hypothetical protein
MKMNELDNTDPEAELRALVGRLIAEPIEPVNQRLNELGKTLVGVKKLPDQVLDALNRLATRQQAQEQRGKLDGLAEQLGALAQLPGDIQAVHAALPALHTRDQAQVQREMLLTAFEDKLAGLRAELRSSWLELVSKLDDTGPMERLRAAFEEKLNESTRRLQRQVAWARHASLAALITLAGLCAYLAAILPRITR